MKKISYILMTLLISLLVWSGSQRQSLAASYYITDGTVSINDIALATNTEAELLAIINNCTVDLTLPVGALITLPCQPALAITVQPGETLYTLAQMYQVSVDDFAAANALSDAAVIHSGQTLLLPLAEESAIYAYQSAYAEMRLVPVLASVSRGDSLQWPADGVITSRFGQRSRGYHYGLDVAADSGSPITAALAGEVSESGWKNDAYGYTVMIDHGNGWQTLYAHCSEILVEEGDYVTRGQTVALMGSTGNSTGPHVHFEVRIGGECHDPLDYLR